MRQATAISIALTLIFLFGGAGEATAAGICTGFGPQTPRDITSIAGKNKRLFTLAPSATELNLCNIHTHTNAEHKGPGFRSLPARARMAGTSATTAIS